MATIAQPSLFSWREIDTASDLDRLRLVLAVISVYDKRFMQLFESLRGRGRDDYPIRPTWNAVLAGIVYQHSSAASLLRELRRNAELRELCGFDPLLGVAAVPSDDAFGRFLETVMGQSEALTELFHSLVTALGRALPDLGMRLAVDSKAIPSFGKPVADEAKNTGDADRRRDVDADWGVKTYKGVRDDGSAWEKTKHWFGYKLHLLVDSQYELPLGFTLTKASAGDAPALLPLVAGLDERHEAISARADELAADKGYDSAEIKATLFDKHHIKPFIDHRQMWKEEPGTPRPLFPDRVDSFLYDEKGKVYCQCLSEGRGIDKPNTMAFVGYERDRMTLKYRCPAAFYGYECPARSACEQLAPHGVGEFGRTLRIPLNRDRRIFTPVARHTRDWEKAYARRTAIERVNSRIDQVLGFEHHTIRGKAKMELRVTLALVVMLAMALGRIQANQADLMRSLTAPVRRAA